MMKKIKPSWSRRKLLILSAVGVVSVVGAYTFFSLNQWNQVASNTEESKQALQNSKEKLFSSSTSASERSTTINKLADVSPLVTCSVGWWGDWQAAVISSAKETEKTCEATRAKQGNTQKAAERTQGFLGDQKKVQVVLEKLSLGKTALGEDDFDKHAKTAISVNKGLEVLLVGDASHSLLEEAQKAAKAISESWKVLQEADKAESRDRYEQSIDKLDQAYLRLNDVSDEAISGYSSLLSDLEADLR